MHEEIYVSRTWLVEKAGFENVELRDFLSRYGFFEDKTDKGFPLSPIIKALNEQQKIKGKRRTFNLAQLEEVKKQEEIIKLQLYNGEKNGTLIKRSYAKDRVRLVFQNVVSKIRYAIKNTAPRLVGLDNARLIEEIITKSWNGAIDLLEEQSKCIDWENDNPTVQLSETKPLTEYPTDTYDDNYLEPENMDSLINDNNGINNDLEMSDGYFIER